MTLPTNLEKGRERSGGTREEMMGSEEGKEEMNDDRVRERAWREGEMTKCDTRS